MARIRQLFPQNYGSSNNISAELENLFRYLNAAEIGNLTIGELLAKIFDDNGNFDGPIEFRRDQSEGIEYRIGEYANAEDGWQSLIELSELRGPAGTSVGQIGLPLLSNRQDYTPADEATTVSYAFEPDDALIVFKNGLLLKSPADYTATTTGGDGDAGLITFTAAFNGTDKVTVFKVRAEDDTGYQRTDHVTASSQSVFGFPHTENSRLFVFKNGILLRGGVGNDYTSSATTDTVTLLTPATAGTTVSIMTVEQPALTTVTGVMLEEAFVDATTGLIKWSTVGVADGAIPQAKVAGLTALASSSAKLTVSSSSPINPATGNFWLDTSSSPAELKFYDGSQWLRTSPPSSIPTFDVATALRFLRVNGTGTGLEFANIDLSSVIPLSQKGAASGVATLDNTAKIPAAQLPTSISRTSLYRVIAGSVTDATYTVARIFNQRISIDSVALRVSAGTLNARLAINGVPFGSTFAVSVTPAEIIFGQGGNVDLPLDVDATGQSRAIDVIVTSASGASNLDISVGAAITP